MRPRNVYRSVQLHTFADALKDGFHAVLYLRVEDSLGVEVSLVIAKVRVAPMHRLTIPHLELQAAIMATRLASFYLKFELLGHK